MKAVLAAARASSASEGRETSTSSGFCGFAVAPSRSRTASTWSGSVRTETRSTRAVVVRTVDRRRRSRSAPRCPARGASVNGSRMPMTVNQRPPSQTREPVVRRSRACWPRRRRARPPGSGSWRRRGSVPCASVAADRVERSDGSAAATAMPPVSVLVDERSLRRTVTPDTAAVAATDSTPDTRRSIAGAASGSTASSPMNDCPGRDLEQVGAEPVELGEQVGLGGLGDAEHGDHRGDADGDAERRQRRPRPPRPQPRARAVAQDVTAVRGGRLIRAEPRDRPSRISTRRGNASAIARSWVITTIVDPAACSSCSSARMSAPVRESRLPVGSSANTIAGRRPAPGRSPPAGARRPTACTAGASSRCARPTASRASRARARRAAGARRCRAGRSATLSSALMPVEQEELLEHEADLARPQRRQRAGRATAPMSLPAMRTVARRRPLQRPIMFSSVDLPDPDGPTTRARLAGAHGQRTPRSASTPPG